MLDQEIPEGCPEGMEVNGVTVFIFCGQPSNHQVLPKPDCTTSESGYIGKVITSLYRWRASGKQLKELAGDETIEIVFELTFR